LGWAREAIESYFAFGFDQFIDFMKNDPRRVHGDATAPWVVEVKGEQGSSFEISIIRDNHEWGRTSWGWFCDEKLLISSEIHGAWSVTPRIWDKLIETAQSIADEMNQQEGFVV